MAFKFTERTIVPGGRYKYGEYLAAGNVTSKISSVVYGGNSSTDVIGGGGGSNNGGDVTDNNFYLFLSQTSVGFEGTMVALSAQTASTRVIGYKGQQQMETYIGVIDQHTTASTSGGEVVYDPPLPANYGITAMVPGSTATTIPTGMEIRVDDNATTGTTLVVSVDNTLTANTGTLYIPCSVSMNAMQDLDDDILDWVKAYEEGKTMSVMLECTWSITGAAQSAYRLDLSNDAGSINCDEDGHVLTGATRPSCDATLYFGLETYTGATFELKYNENQNVSGLTCETVSGVCHVVYDTPAGTYFDFDGDHLDVKIIAKINNQEVGNKVFTIAKSLPHDGQAATSYWLTFNSSSVKVNPNASPISVIPNTITAQVMMQVGQEAPTAATGCSIYYGYTDSPVTAYPNTGVTVNISYEALYFVAKKGNVIVDGVEQIPILRDGTNASSPYRLDLTNENASINCDAQGNILSGATRPHCEAQLYFGTSAVTSGVTYSATTSTWTTGFDCSTGGTLTFNDGTAQTPFNFTGATSLEITVEAWIGNNLCGTAIMTVTKALAGTDGTPATTYWLNLSNDAVKIDTNSAATPSAITITAYKQIGDTTPVSATDATIAWGFDGSLNKTSNTITGFTGHSYATVQLKVNNVQRDIETIPILYDGAPGSADTRQGAAIRGPIDWWDGSNQIGRRWCNGVLTDPQYPEDEKWIDVVIYSGVTYYCNTSYNEEGLPFTSQTVFSKWTSADTEFDFVATNILLANNAKIRFMTGNEIYLIDDKSDPLNPQVTAGAAGGKGLVFWAGGDKGDDPAFQVHYDGSIKATSGIFSGYIQMPYTFISALNPDLKLSASTVTARFLSQTNFLGRFSQDPYYGDDDPDTPRVGESYCVPYSTVPHANDTYYYCRTKGSWTQLYRCKEQSPYDPSIYYDIERGYVADNRAYLIADDTSGFYGMGDGGMLVLPEPSSSLNGFTYHILVVGNPATRVGTENPGISVMAANSSSAFSIYCYAQGIKECKRLSFYGGHVEMTCVPEHDSNNNISYRWAVTQSTGGVDCYSGTTSSSFIAGYSTICGYSTVDSFNCITKIKADGAPDGSDHDTLYITRS